MMAAAAKIRTRPTRSYRARKSQTGSRNAATESAIHAAPPNPASSPATKKRYVFVMSGSLAPIACRPILHSPGLYRGIIRGSPQSNRVERYTARGRAIRGPTTWPRKVEPVVPVSSTVTYFPIEDGSPGIITVLKSRVRA